MKRHYRLRVFLIIVIITVFLVVLQNFTLCTMRCDSYESVYESVVSEINSDKNDVCVLDYDYVTGAGWKVEKSTTNELTGTYVLLDSAFNPRDLKINKDFELDYSAKFVLIIDKQIKQVQLDNEMVDVIKASEIIIVADYEDSIIKFCDLTFAGKLKTILGAFIPIYRVHY